MLHVQVQAGPHDDSVTITSRRSASAHSQRHEGADFIRQRSQRVVRQDERRQAYGAAHIHTRTHTSA